MHFTGEQRFKAYRRVCTIRQVGERVHKEFTTGQIRGSVHCYAGTHRGPGHSIGKGAES